LNARAGRIFDVVPAQGRNDTVQSDSTRSVPHTRRRPGECRDPYSPTFVLPMLERPACFTTSPAVIDPPLKTGTTPLMRLPVGQITLRNMCSFFVCCGARRPVNLLARKNSFRLQCQSDRCREVVRRKISAFVFPKIMFPYGCPASIRGTYRDRHDTRGGDAVAATASQRI